MIGIRDDGRGRQDLAPKAIVAGIETGQSVSSAAVRPANLQKSHREAGCGLANPPEVGMGESSMKSSKFTGEQIALALPYAEASRPMADACGRPEPIQIDLTRRMGFSAFAAPKGGQHVQPRAGPGTDVGVLGPNGPSTGRGR